MISNLKNDVIAKNEYIEILKREGYDNARVTSAATLTEWKSAIENQNTYYFVVAIQKNDEWIFSKYSFDEFMQFSNILPFKVFFNIPDTTIKSLPANKKQIK